MFTEQDIKVGEVYKLHHYEPVERTVLKIDPKKERITYQKGDTNETGEIPVKSFVRLYNQWGVKS